MILLCHSAHCYESSFPFPFEFGHSSDIYLKDYSKKTKAQIQEIQRINELLVQKGYSKEPTKILKYIKNNNIEAIKLLLDSGVDPNLRIYGSSCIYYAVKYKRSEILKMLFERGADQHLEIYSLVREAILNHDIDCAKIAIENGADVNYLEGIVNETLLNTALKKKEYGIAKLLIDNGAKIDMKSGIIIKKQKLDKKYGFFVD